MGIRSPPIEHMLEFFYFFLNPIYLKKKKKVLTLAERVKDKFCKTVLEVHPVKLTATLCLEDGMECLLELHPERKNPTLLSSCHSMDTTFHNCVWFTLLKLYLCLTRVWWKPVYYYHFLQDIEILSLRRNVIFCWHRSGAIEAESTMIFMMTHVRRESWNWANSINC